MFSRLLKFARFHGCWKLIMLLWRHGRRPFGTYSQTLGRKVIKGKCLRRASSFFKNTFSTRITLEWNLMESDTYSKIGCFATIEEKRRHHAWFQLWSQLTFQRSMPCSREIYLLLGRDIVRSARYWPQESPKFYTLKTCKEEWKDVGALTFSHKFNQTNMGAWFLLAKNMFGGLLHSKLPLLKQ